MEAIPVAEGPESKTDNKLTHASKGCVGHCTSYISTSITHYPVLLFAAVITTILAITIGGALAGSYNMSTPTKYDWFIPDGRAAEQAESLELAEADAIQDPSPRSREDMQMWFVYKWDKAYSIFNSVNVQTMCNIEQLFLQTPGYDTMCKLNSTISSCLEPTNSVTYIFYGSVMGNSVSCPLLLEQTVNDTANNLYAKLNGSLRLRVGFFMEKNTEERKPKYTSITRSMIPLGSPVDGYTSKRDRESEQYEKVEEFYKRVKGRFFDFFDMRNSYLYSAYRTEVKHNGLGVLFYSFPLQNLESASMINDDFTLAICSMAFVFMWMCVHLQSIFLASVSIFQVVLSIPFALFIYRNVYQIAYFDSIHILVVFLVLGIGADDIFVFFDGWRSAKVASQKFKLEPNSQEELDARMTIAYAHTVSAVFNTSFTTVVAFLATAVSPIMPISTFGILAATAIFVNYLFVISLTPTLVVCYHLWFERKHCCCFKRLQRNESISKVVPCQHDPNHPLKDGFKSEVAAPIALACSPKRTHIHPLKNKATLETVPSRMGLPEDSPRVRGTSPMRVAIREDKSQDNRNTRSESNFDFAVKRCYVPCMKVRQKGIFTVSLVVALGLLAYGAVNVGFASQLTTPSEPMQWFPEDHMFVKAPRSLEKDFLAGSLDEYEVVKIPFGIKGIRRPNFNLYKPGENRGETVYDSDFDLYSPTSQDAYNSACTKVRDHSCDKQGCRQPYLVWPSEDALRCFLTEFQSWFMARNPGFNTYNCTRETFFRELRLYRNSSDTDLGITYKQEMIGFIDEELKYVSIHTYSTMHKDASTQRKKEVRSVWDQFTRQINADSPSGMNNAFATSSSFVWIESEEGTVSGFYEGLAIVFPVAYVVLIVATQNVILASYAIVSIGLIVSCVLGMIQAYLGWYLGIAEAIAGIIVIGFSVDYVIHLGHMYVEAGREEGLETREERFTYAAENMVSTVVAGGITTFGAALPLFACQMTFFPKMGTLMTSTIAFSITYSVGFFLAVCLLLGPTGVIGDLWWIAKKIKLNKVLKMCGVEKAFEEKETRRGPKQNVKHHVQNKGSAAKDFDKKFQA